MPVDVDSFYQVGERPITRRYDLEPPRQKNTQAMNAIRDLQLNNRYQPRTSVPPPAKNLRGAREIREPITQTSGNRTATAGQDARATAQQQIRTTSRPAPRTTGAYELPTVQRSANTMNEPTTQQRSRKTKKGRQRWGQLCDWWDNRTREMRIALVLFSILAFWILGVNVFSFCVATFGDPLTYSQLAHKDKTIIDFHGHQVEARAFVNQNGYLELVLVPDDVNKSTLIVGPPVYSTAPDRLMIQVQSHGTKITVNAIAPRDVVWFVAPRQSSVPWTVDLATSQQPKGGK